ncbi:MAG: sigma-54-dependent Fis family transcriptional regulator [Geobacter sp.]|nr:MAG: sigma-54-dependent Fis family transcriptional regulator [Geobacter sp.]
MKNILVAWIGRTDLRAAVASDQAGLGPIAQALESRKFSHVYLLNNYPNDETATYLSWLKLRTQASIFLHSVLLTSPTNFGEIYAAAVAVIEQATQKHDPKSTLTFHLSPGTPAMAAVWILLAKSRYSAELIESSIEQGVQSVSIPFDISADFIPSLLQKSDERLEQLSAGLPPEAPAFDQIVHRSPVMQRIIAKAQRIALRSVPVLIEGESGTGKELLARAIRQASPRHDKPFIAVNCGAIPLELIESEFFGHKKGSFTGASQDRKGNFEAANEGTLFLDEIGELPPLAQVKILRVLQEREVVKVGDTRPVKIDVRIIAATNRTLIKEVSAGAFRADLYYRLAVAVILLPPLREREGDISLLIDHMLHKINSESCGEPGFVCKEISANARNVMLSYPWPGNARELFNALHRAAVWSIEEIISVEDIREILIPTSSPDQNQGDIITLGNGVNLPEILANIIRKYLSLSIKETGGNKTRATKLLGLPNYQTYTNWLEKYGVEE